MYNLINTLFHLIGFGIVLTSLLGGWIIEQKLRTEKEWNQRLFLGKISFQFSFLFPVACIILFLTGFLKILSLYGGSFNILYTEGWLIAKIILFAFLLINGTVFGPILARRRTKLIQGISEKNINGDTEMNIKIINKSISKFYLVQFILLIIILYLSAVGAEEHQSII